MKYLIITSSGGNAHLSVAKTERDRLIATTCKADELYVVDITGVDESVAQNKDNPWIPHWGIPFTNLHFFSGKKNVARWNSSQTMGGLEGVRNLEWLIDHQQLAEHIQSRELYQKITAFLQSNPELEEIIDTQALSTETICRAVTDENTRRKAQGQQPIRVRKIISEFITDKTVHYLNPISNVAKEHAECLTAEVVNSPLRPFGESEMDFYKRKKVDHVRFEIKNAPLRAEFRNPDYAKQHTVYLKTAEDALIGGKLKEREFVRDLLEQPTEDKPYFKLQKEKNDTFVTITLGSQGSVTILRYIDAFIDEIMATKLNPDQRVRLFIAAGKNDGSTKTLYALVRQHIESRLNELKAVGIKWPESVKMIPLSFQDDKSMASLFQNSDVLVTRTGGMSSIEANETQSFNPARRVYLHSEATPTIPGIFPKQHFDACYQSLLHGTVRWEGGNAQYLMQHINACLAAPETIQFISPIPQYQKSLFQMALEGELDAAHQPFIVRCLDNGSDPNLISMGELPALAYARDLSTLEVFIQYGGKLTKAAKTHLIANGLTSVDLEKASQLQVSIQREIKTEGAPNKLKIKLIEAIQNNNLETMRGLLYRYPKLAFIPSVEVAARGATHREALDIVQLAKGATPLHLAMKELSSIPPHLQTYFIYCKRADLNIPFPEDVTPLTLCKKPELREYMVKLGANPRYLSKKVTLAERNHLKQLYRNTETLVNELKKSIVSSYNKSNDDEELFYLNLKQILSQPQWGISSQQQGQLEKMVKSIFYEMKSARNEVARMSVVEKLVNFIRGFFGQDATSRHARLQSRAFIFNPLNHPSQDSPAGAPHPNSS